MPRNNEVDACQLFALWHDSSVTRAEVCRRLGITEGRLALLARRYGLPRRSSQHRANSMLDATPEDDAASASSLAIAPALREAAERMKALHYEQRRRECVGSTTSKTSKWRRGLCLPK